jgi:hypothetical protein
LFLSIVCRIGAGSGGGVTRSIASTRHSLDFSTASSAHHHFVSLHIDSHFESHLFCFYLDLDLGTFDLSVENYFHTIGVFVHNSDADKCNNNIHTHRHHHHHQQQQQQQWQQIATCETSDCAVACES